MPLYKNAVDLLRTTLDAISKGQKVKPVAIGMLTKQQLDDINLARQNRIYPLPVIIPEVLFFGQHIYNSRIVKDGYG